MAKAPDPDWLMDLHFLDRALARRWIKAYGEARVQRIARAAQQVQRPPHRQAVNYAPQLHRAFILWALDAKLDADEAARLAARTITAEKDWKGLPPISEIALRNRLRTAMREKVKPENLTLGEMVAASTEAAARGGTTRFDATFACFGAAFPRFDALLSGATEAASLAGRIVPNYSFLLRGLSVPQVTAPSALPHPVDPLAPRHGLEKLSQGLAQTMAGLESSFSVIERMAEIARRGVAFGNALGVPMPPSMPISQVAAILRDHAAGFRERLSVDAEDGDA